MLYAHYIQFCVFDLHTFRDCVFMFHDLILIVHANITMCDNNIQIFVAKSNLFTETHMTYIDIWLCPSPMMTPENAIGTLW